MVCKCNYFLFLSGYSLWKLRTLCNKKILEVNPEFNWKDWCWSWSLSVLVSWCKQLTHWKRLCCLERWKAEGEEGIKGLDGWMASLMQWTWTLANSRRWWGTGSLACCGPWGHRVVHDWVTEQQQLKLQVSASFSKLWWFFNNETSWFKVESHHILY